MTNTDRRLFWLMGFSLPKPDIDYMLEVSSLIHEIYLIVLMAAQYSVT